jgi:hypothetical protein
MHENLSRLEEVPISSERAFGLVFVLVFLIVGCLPLIDGESPRVWAIVIAAALVGITLVAPRLLRWPNRLWMSFGLLLHRIVSPIALGLIFYAAVLPTGLLLRLFGKDLLRLRREPRSRTYWIERTPPGPPPGSLKDQF